MQTWKDMVKLALVGTARVEGVLLETPPAAGSEDSEDPAEALMGRLSAKHQENRERELLGRSAVLACCRRVGRLMEVDSRELPAPAEAEELPRISSAAVLDLDRMLQGEYVEALPDWLAAVAARRRSVPESRLAELLELGERRKELQSLITGVIGRRGQWLAARNPDWQYATQRNLFVEERGADGGTLPNAGERERIWQTGDREARLALLEQLRAVEPAQATALVASTWAQDPAEERALFLDTFAVGLSLDDEPLLERALDDKRKEVRQRGQTLLYQLPDSRLIARMMDRARPLVRYEASPGLQVDPPTACDRAMQRDGIAPKPPSWVPNTGERTWWLQQIISAVPLTCWEQWLDKTPAEILRCGGPEEWRDLLLNAWYQALQRFPTRKWAEVLLEEWIQKPRTGGAFDSSRLLWHTLLPQPVLERRLTELIRADLRTLGAHHLLNNEIHHLLSECKQVWGTDLTNAVLASFKFILPSYQYGNYHVASYLEKYAPLMSLDATEEIRILCEMAPNETYLRGQVERHYALVQFRNEMLKRI